MLMLVVTRFFLMQIAEHVETLFMYVGVKSISTPHTAQSFGKRTTFAADAQALEQ
jgi:hypothetical protein